MCSNRIVIGVFVLSMLMLVCSPIHAGAVPVTIAADQSIPQVRFAAREIEAAFRARGHAVSTRSLRAATDEAEAILVVVKIKPSSKLGPQSYRLKASDAKSFIVTGADPVGAMYGGLHLAEVIRIEKNLQDVEDAIGKPYILKRGLKFNIPLDARTPSYDDTGDAAQNNIAEMWNFEFWKEFLDNMARHRYNTLTLWNPHPFPSMIKLKDYTDVALEDVCVTTLKPVATAGAWNEPQLITREIFDNCRVVKKMTIDEKIAYWRKVMRYAKDRGVDIYFITWNICVNSVAPAGYARSAKPQHKHPEPKGKYGVTNDQDNPATIKYLRASVKEFVLTYPELAGIGVTAGENMKNRNDEFAKEKWLWNTYGMGILDAKKQQPNREIKFIHRVWYTGIGNIVKEFGSKYPDPFELSFKYARARLYSSTKPPFVSKLLDEMKPHGLKCWWNLRNDDIFCHRWGDPDYVREFILNFPYDQTAGYHMGSDGYVWGREFTSLDPENPRQLEIIKHWYSFMLWGRLGYNPKLDRTFFEKVLTSRFPEADSAVLYDAWRTASKIIPQVNRFHWRNWDFMWAVEGCMDQQNGFHTVNDFVRCGPMEGSGIISIPDYVKAIRQGRKTQQTTALQVADNLDEWADRALKKVAQLRSQCSPSKQLHQTLTDIESMSYLGRYYAAKIRGAFQLAMFQATNDPQAKSKAGEYLTEAVKHWQAYANKAASQYKPQLLARTRHLDWVKLLEDVKKDVDIVRNTQP